MKSDGKPGSTIESSDPEPKTLLGGTWDELNAAHRIARIVDISIFCGSIALFLHAAYSYWPYLEDDTFIFIRYALQFHAGHGWVMNPGERVNGCTSWLQLWIVTFLTKSLSIDQTVEILKCSGVLCGIATLYSTRKIANYCMPSAPFVGSISCALIASVHFFTLSMINGLETPVACLFLSLGIYNAVQYGTEVRRGYAAAFCFLLASLARPEMTLIFVAILAARIALKRPLHIGPIICFGLPLCAVFAMSAAYYGSPLPNTYYAKYATFQQGILEGDVYLAVNLFNYSLLLGAGAAVAAVMFGASPKSRARAVVVPALCAYMMAVFRTHGDWMLDGRFATPLLPYVGTLWAFGAITAVQAVIAAWPARTAVLFRTIVVTIAFCAFIRAFASLNYRSDDYTSRNIRSRAVLWPSATMPQLSMWMCGSQYGRIVLAKWIRSNTTSGEWVATTEMGLVTCLNPDIRFLDLWGLTDSTIAHLPNYARSYSGVFATDDWARPDTPYGGYLEHRKPTYVLIAATRSVKVSPNYTLAASLPVYIDNSGQREFLVFRRK